MRVDPQPKSQPGPEAIRGALQRLLTSRTFAASSRLSRFLKFGVDAALSGRTGINEYSIGIDVFEKKSNFDPRIDPIVRVHARRLRSKLRQYYEGEGADEPIEIGLPLRTYVPVFRPRAPRQLPAKRTPAFRPEAEAEDSILVIPFTNLSAVREDEYFADGLTQELIHALSTVKSWRVVAWHPGGDFRHPDLREAARQLEVQAAIWGTVRKGPKSLRISVELSSVPDRTVLWSHMYEVAAEDVVLSQEKLARAICAALRQRLQTPERGPILPGASPTTSYLYLKGEYQSRKHDSTSLQKARTLFGAAIKEQPGFARAHEALAQTLALLVMQAEHAPRELMPEARQAAETALDLDPGLGEAHGVLGLVSAVYDWDLARAEAEFSLGMQLGASPFTLGWYAATCLTATGRWKEAIACLERARERDPLLPGTANTLAYVHLATGNFEQARYLIEEALDLEPGCAITHWTQGMLCVAQNHLEPAIAAFERACQFSIGLSYTRASLAHARAVAGDHGEANRILAQLVKSSLETYIPANELAMIHFGLRDTEAALNCLDAARQQRCVWLHRLRSDPRLSAIADEARLGQLFREPLSLSLRTTV